MSRASEMNILNQKMILPTVKKGFYLISYLQEMGYCIRQKEGVAPIPMTEILAWLQSASLELSHNERMHIKSLSEAFVSALSESSMKGAMPYYTKTKTDIRNKFKDAVSVLNKK